MPVSKCRKTRKIFVSFDVACAPLDKVVTRREYSSATHVRYGEGEDSREVLVMMRRKEEKAGKKATRRNAILIYRYIYSAPWLPKPFKEAPLSAPM